MEGNNLFKREIKAAQFRGGGGWKNMAAKRKLDPDYQDLAKHQAKRQRIIELDAQKTSEETIRKIARTQFQTDIEDKGSEIMEIDKKLQETRDSMDRLRALIVASFFSKKRGQAGQEEDASAATSSSVHPTVKKYLGKAPVGAEVKTEVSDPSSTQSIRRSSPSTSADKSQSGIEYCQTLITRTSTESKTAVPAAPTSSAALAVQKPVQEWEQGDARFSMKRTIIVGNCSRYLLANQCSKKNGYTHKWMMYVRGPKDNPDITDIVSKVFFFLDASYQPHDLVEVKEPPFHLTRQGWGEFPVRVQVHFRDTRNRPIDIIHNLALDKTYTGLQTLGAETVLSIDLLRDLSLMPRVRPAACPSTPDQVMVEPAIKQEPESTDAGETHIRKFCKCGAPLQMHHTCQHGPESTMKRKDVLQEKNGYEQRREDCEWEGVQQEKDCQKRSRKDCELKKNDDDVNIVIKEEPSDDYGDTIKPSIGVLSCQNHADQSDLAKEEPCDEYGDTITLGITVSQSQNHSDLNELVIEKDLCVVTQPVLNKGKTPSCVDSIMLTSENEREKIQNSVSGSNKSGAVSLNTVTGNVTRKESTDMCHSGHSLLAQNGKPVGNFSQSAVHSESVVAETTVSVQKQDLLNLQSPRDRRIIQISGGQTSSRSKVQLLNAAQPQSSTDSALLSQNMLTVAQGTVTSESGNQVYLLNTAQSQGKTDSMYVLKAAQSQGNTGSVPVKQIPVLKVLQPQKSIVSSKPSSTPVEQYVVVGPSGLPNVSGAVSLLAAGKGPKLANTVVKKEPVSSTGCVMEVTHKGLKPVHSNTVMKMSQSSADQSVSFRSNSPVVVQRSSQAQSVNAKSQSPLVGHAASRSTLIKIPAASEKPQYVIVQPAKVSNNSTGQTQRSTQGMRSLLKTAARPNIQAALQKSSASFKTPVSQSRQASSSVHSVSSPASLSGSAQISGPSSSSLAATTPGLRFVLQESSVVSATPASQNGQTLSSVLNQAASFSGTAQIPDPSFSSLPAVSVTPALQNGQALSSLLSASEASLLSSSAQVPGASDPSSALPAGPKVIVKVNRELPPITLGYDYSLL